MTARAFAGDSSGRLHVAVAAPDETVSTPSLRYIRLGDDGVERVKPLIPDSVLAADICYRAPSVLFVVAATETKIYAFRSDDGGDEWVLAGEVEPSEDAPVTKLDLRCPGDENLVVLSRHLGRDDVRVFSSTDQGVSFVENELDLNEGRESPVYLPAGWQACAAGNDVYVGFVDFVPHESNRVAKVYASADGAQSFSPVVRVTSSYWNGGFDLACDDDGRVNFVGRDRSMLSRDRAATWQDVAPPLSVATSAEQVLAGAVGDNLFVVYNLFGGTKAVYSSADGGETWADQQTLWQQGGSGTHRFVGSSATTTMAWETISGNERDIWFASSSDQGMTWQDPPMPLTEEAAERRLIGVDSSGSHTYFVWFESDDGHPVLHAARYSD